MVHGCYAHWKDQAQYALCDECVFNPQWPRHPSSTEEMIKLGVEAYIVIMLLSKTGEGWRVRSLYFLQAPRPGAPGDKKNNHFSLCLSIHVCLFLFFWGGGSGESEVTRWISDGELLPVRTVWRIVRTWIYSLTDPVHTYNTRNCKLNALSNSSVFIFSWYNGESVPCL